MKELISACEFALIHNLGLSPEESVLVLSDNPKQHIGQAFFEAARRISGQVELLEMPVPEFNGQEPPGAVAAKMLTADVVIMPTSKSLSWTKARAAATEKGARIISMARLTEDIILRTFRTDYRPIKQRVNRLCDLLDAASSVTITTAKGTNLTFSIAGRIAHGRSGGIYTENGKWGNLPCGEAFIAPLEGTANGVYVVDASQAGVGRLQAPIHITVRKGLAKTITGGKQASAFAEMLAAVNDPNAYNIAEFGIGGNHAAQISGITLEDEKVLGTCHIALGSNHLFGGRVDAGIHVDGVIRNPTITLDDQIIMKDGVLLSEEG